MCGLEGHLGDSRKLGSSSSRRRNLKSSNTVVNDFALWFLLHKNEFIKFSITISQTITSLIFINK